MHVVYIELITCGSYACLEKYMFFGKSTSMRWSRVNYYHVAVIYDTWFHGESFCVPDFIHVFPRSIFAIRLFSEMRKLLNGFGDLVRSRVTRLSDFVTRSRRILSRIWWRNSLNLVTIPRMDPAPGLPNGWKSAEASPDRTFGGEFPGTKKGVIIFDFIAFFLSSTERINWASNTWSSP